MAGRRVGLIRMLLEVLSCSRCLESINGDLAM
jgi:hypothetical protein